MIIKTLIPSTVLLLLSTFAAGAASPSGVVARILAQSSPPEGIVFEIVSGDPAMLRRAIPRVKKDIERLRARFPKLAIAVVSHGNEQFALTKENSKKYKEVHRDIKSLVKDAGVPVHICGGYAQMNGVSEDAFPDYVEVAATGPLEIRSYEEFGYRKIVVTDSWLKDLDQQMGEEARSLAK